MPESLLICSGPGANAPSVTATSASSARPQNQASLSREMFLGRRFGGCEESRDCSRDNRWRQRFFKFLPRYRPRLGAPVGAQDQGHCCMISLPCDVNGLLINLKLKHAWWMRLRHSGKLERSNDSDAFHCCLHDGTVPVGRMLECRVAGQSSICRHFGGGLFPWRWGPGASVIGSPPPGRGETFSRIRSQAQFSLLLVGAVELIWLDDARSYPFRIKLCSTKMRKIKHNGTGPGF
ncbi:hypothetical protein SAMN03159422_05265 [Agrobacterium fabrum]|nr:hypothetical protein SAMN03159422_05265 [Agrobacterium fabrum]SES24313.1 hypothetical protein SAMN03159504_05258 [Agrobacterium fabrum]